MSTRPLHKYLHLHDFSEAFAISVHWHRGQRRHLHCGIISLNPVPNWFLLSRYRTGSGIGGLVHSGSGLIECRTFRLSGVDKKSIPRKSTLQT
jgi:hypothetical protein